MRASRKNYSLLQVRRATDGDLTAVLALFDDVVLWLAAHGWSEQWGTTPFSQSHVMVTRFKAWITHQSLFLAQRDGVTLGTLVLNERPPFYAKTICASYPQEIFYLEAFATDRRAARQGVGHYLLTWAEEMAIEKGKSWLLLDCWARNPRLRRYYREAGFVERQIFTVGNWQGMLFERCVRQDGDEEI